MSTGTVASFEARLRRIADATPLLLPGAGGRPASSSSGESAKVSMRPPGARAATEKRLPVSDGYAGYRVVRLLEAAQASLRQAGETVEIRDALAIRQGARPVLEVGL